MALGATEPANAHSAADVILADALRAHGSTGHPYTSSPLLLSAPGATRNLADLVHCLCELHGRSPGVIDLAVERVEGPAHTLLAQAAQGFADERAWLTRLVVASGPLPSTPGQAESEAALVGQSHALEMLGRSERKGCALGAALALLADWHAIRAVLDIAADRFGLDPQAIAIPALGDIGAIADKAANDRPAYERALGFGAEQLLLQHRGLWDLLEARESARRDPL